MPATNVRIINASDKNRQHTNAIGTGIPAAADKIVTDIETYPVGSTYLDLTNKTIYHRVAVTGAIGDWWLEALTQLT
jgi:hypothetical protein